RQFDATVWSATMIERNAPPVRSLSQARSGKKDVRIRIAWGRRWKHSNIEVDVAVPTNDEVEIARQQRNQFLIGLRNRSATDNRDAEVSIEFDDRATRKERRDQRLL